MFFQSYLIKQFNYYKRHLDCYKRLVLIMSTQSRQYSSSFYRCKCYLTHNYYTSKYDVHLKYIDGHQLISDYDQVLYDLGCQTDEQRQELIQDLEKEFERREGLEIEKEKRMLFIKENYIPLNRDVYQLNEEHLDPQFIEIVKACKSGSDKDDVVKKMKVISPHKRIFQFPVLTNTFCCKLMQEIENFSASSMPKSRPNTMNNHGVMLNELGFDDSFMSPLRNNYLNAICQVLYPEYYPLDSHRAFTVKYKVGQDIELGTHFDNSEVTLNICIGGEFEENEVYFGEYRYDQPIGEERFVSVTPVVHLTGHGVLHLGQQMHGAMPLVDGERHNVVIWLRSSLVRNQLCPMCKQKPDLIEASGFGDGFTNVDVVNEN